METITSTRTAKSHTQSRDHGHDRHDPDRDRALVRVRLLVPVPAHRPDRRVRNLGPPGRGPLRDRGLDRAPRRPRTHRCTTTTKAAVRGKAKRHANDRELRPNRQTKRNPSTTRAPARLRPIHHQSTKRAKRNTIAEGMTGTTGTVGTSTEAIGIARPRTIETKTGTGIAIAIEIATTRAAAATIGTIIERTTAAVAAATGTETNGTSIAVVVAVIDTVTIGIDLQSTTGIGTVEDKIVLLWSVGFFFIKWKCHFKRNHRF